MNPNECLVPGGRVLGCVLVIDEGHTIGNVLDSLARWCDKVMIAAHCDDEVTTSVAISRGVPVVVIPDGVVELGTGSFPNELLRRLSQEYTENDWLFILKANQEVPLRLGLVLKQLTLEWRGEFDGLILPLRHEFCGRELNCSAMWTEYDRPQLFKRERYLPHGPCVEVNERAIRKFARFQADGLDLALLDCSVRDLPHWITRLNRDTDAEAERLLTHGAAHSWKAQIAHFMHEWQTCYNSGRREGYQEGIHGFTFAFLSGFQRFAARAKLWDLRRQRNLLVNLAETEPVPPSLREVLDFMERVAREGAGPWVRESSGRGGGTPPLERVPAEWLREDADIAQEDNDAFFGGSNAATPMVSGADTAQQPPSSGIASCIAVRNEGDILVDALRSVAGWAHPILVIDNGSTDDTIEVARRFTDHVASVTNVRGHLEVVRFAVADQVYRLGEDDGTSADRQESGHRWVLFLDADERVPDRLAQALVRLIARHGDDFDALFLPFRWHFCGKWMRHGGQWPGYKAVPQLIKQGTYLLNPHVHWGIEPLGRSRYFPADDPELSVIHYSVKDVAHYIAKENRATTQEAQLRYEQGGWDHSWQAQMAHFLLDWRDSYETCRGSLDGMHGFVLSFLRGVGRYWVRAKLWDIRRQRGELSPEEDAAVPGSVAEVLAFLRRVYEDDPERWLPRLSLAPPLPTDDEFRSQEHPWGRETEPFPVPYPASAPLAEALRVNEAKRTQFPLEAGLLFEAGHLYQQAGRFDEARACLEFLVQTPTEQLPRDPAFDQGAEAEQGLRTYRGWHALALLFERLGDGPHAAAVLRDIVTEYPDYAGARTDLERLEASLLPGIRQDEELERLIPLEEGVVPEHLGGHAGITNMDEPILEWLLERFRPAGFLDLGCGPGGMVKAARERGLTALGVDGDATVEPDLLHDYTLGPLSSDQVKEIEARLPRPRLLWSVEFVEHVDEAFLPHLMATFGLADVVFLTHALPGQGGHHHVNEQTADYWRAVMASAGLRWDEAATAACRAVALNRYTRGTGSVFVRR